MSFLNTETVKHAYNNLAGLELQDANTAFYFMLIKACGINNVTFESPDFIAHNGLYYASRMSTLFAPSEQLPKECGFINPFSMREWPPQPIKESLKKWITSRLKNNICGGGMQWRSIIDLDTKPDEKRIKLKYDYVNIIKNMAFGANTINLVALAVWSNRFTEFKNKITTKELCNEFIRSYKLTPEEVSAFFTNKVEFDIEFENHMCDAAEIRNLIGAPNNGAWKNINLDNSNNDGYVLNEKDYLFDAIPVSTQEVDVHLLEELLNSYYQLILSGPPGTSKSYYASELAKLYDEVVHIQFHPQFSYQNFVGGYVVEKSDVVFKKGILLNLIDESHYDKNKKYLIIIDEFNRANVSQVLGETVQCLDRNQSVEICVDGILKKVSLPINIHIITTLNSTDKTLGTIDYAIRRRFMEVYCSPNPNLLIDLCSDVGFISLCDFLRKVNANIIKVTGARDLCIGHALFLNDSVYDGEKYCWTFSKFRVLYNYKILPMIQEYCSNNQEMVESIMGFKLSTQLDEENFEKALLEFVER